MAWRDPRKKKAYQRAYYARNQQRLCTESREARIRRQHAIDGGDYQRMYDEQDGLCAICGNSSDKNLHIDHDHETGAVRGLLCLNCNRGLGLLRDSLETLHSAIDYLECHAIDQRMAGLRSELG